MASLEPKGMSTLLRPANISSAGLKGGRFVYSSMQRASRTEPVGLVTTMDKEDPGGSSGSAGVTATARKPRETSMVSVTINDASCAIEFVCWLTLELSGGEAVRLERTVRRNPRPDL